MSAAINSYFAAKNDALILNIAVKYITSKENFYYMI